MERLVVIGGGGHAKVLVCLLKKLPYEVVGYTDRQSMGALLGVQYLGNDEILRDLGQRDGACRAAIGLGKVDASPARMQLLLALTALGFDCPVVVSPQAVVNEGVTLGSGTIVADGAVVNSGTQSGLICILNTNSTVEHDCRLGDNVHIAPGATVSGGVTIGGNCLIGAGSTVLQDVVICADCLIGAGSTVVGDISVPGTYVGNPARRIR